MLRQQHFMYQRKNLYIRNLYEVFQARQQQRIFTKSIHSLRPLFFAHPSPYFIQDSVGEGDCWAAPAVWCQKIVRGRRIISEGRVAWSGVWHSTVFYEGTEVLLYFEDKKY